jgi:hypothetical protein
MDFMLAILYGGAIVSDPVFNNFVSKLDLKGLSHEIDFKNVVENGQILALIRAAAGFLIFRRLLRFLVEIKHQCSGEC